MAEPPFTMSKYGSELELLRDKCAWLEARLASAPVEDIPEAWLVTARYVSATGSTLKALCGDEESARSYIAGLNAGSFTDVAMRPLYLGAAPKMPVPDRFTSYERNLLGSCENWLRTRSAAVWAKEFSHDGLMMEYARDIKAILSGALDAPASEPKEPVL